MKFLEEEKMTIHQKQIFDFVEKQYKQGVLTLQQAINWLKDVNIIIQD